MSVPISSLSLLGLIKAMGSFRMRQAMVFIAFSLVGLGLAFSDAIYSEGEVVLVVFTLAGFVATYAMEHRKEARFPVLLHAMYAHRNSVAAEGVVESLSLSGCAIRSVTLPPASGTDIRLHLYLPGETPPIEIPKALVRWTQERKFGVQFSEMELGHKERLRDLIGQLPRSLVSQGPVAMA